MFDKEAITQITSRYRILFVEDDAIIAQSMERALQRFFQEVYVANDGTEGLELYRTHHPDLIISDIRMPLMDGITMSREIRKEDREIPIVIASAHNDESFFLDAIHLGVSDFLIKPLEIHAVLERLASVCERIKNREDAERFRKEQIAHELSRSHEDAIRDLGNALLTPFMLAEGDKVVHVNRAFLELLDPVRLQEFVESKSLAQFDRLLSCKKGMPHRSPRLGIARSRWFLSTTGCVFMR